MLKTAVEKKSRTALKEWELVFNRSPVEIVASKNENETAKLLLAVNQLKGDDWENPLVEDTGIRETVDCGIVLKSIGYKSLPLSEELPFDHSKGIIHQTEGRVTGMPGMGCLRECGKVVHFLYV